MGGYEKYRDLAIEIKGIHFQLRLYVFPFICLMIWLYTRVLWCVDGKFIKFSQVYIDCNTLYWSAGQGYSSTTFRNNNIDQHYRYEASRKSNLNYETSS